jgi:hypothetical protein
VADANRGLGAAAALIDAQVRGPYSEQIFDYRRDAVARELGRD